MTWSGFLASEWVFYFCGTAPAERNPHTLAKFFEALAARGIPPTEILAKIRGRPAGERTEASWQFEKRFAKPTNGASKPSTEEIFAKAKKELKLK